MKRILFDMVCRTAWGYAAAALFVIVATLASGILSHSTGFPEILLLIPVTAFCGPGMLSLELRKGAARALQSLPVSRATLARTCWCYAVLIPTLLAFATIMAFAIVRKNTGSEAESTADVCLITTFIFAWLGTTFWVLTQLDPQPPESGWKRHRAMLFSGCWGLTIGGGYFVAQAIPSTWENVRPAHWLGLAVCLILSWVGWRSTESLLTGRSDPLQTIPKESPQIKQLFRPGESGGLFFLCKTSTLQSLKLSTLFFGTVGIVTYTIGVKNLSLPFQFFTVPAISFIFIWSVENVKWLALVRHLRTLPISTARLTALLFGIFLSGPILLSAMLVFLQWLLTGHGPSAMFLNTGLVLFGIYALIPGTTLACGARKSIVVSLLLLPLLFASIIMNASMPKIDVGAPIPSQIQAATKTQVTARPTLVDQRVLNLDGTPSTNPNTHIVVIDGLGSATTLTSSATPVFNASLPDVGYLNVEAHVVKLDGKRATNENLRIHLTVVGHGSLNPPSAVETPWFKSIFIGSGDLNVVSCLGVALAGLILGAAFLHRAIHSSSNTYRSKFDGLFKGQMG